ncbi:MAG: penicillin-binding protein 2 [Patescibacteria group bacterium]|nr:penicillin-binding protein 2 [Patescibacteria group bacterium]
MFEFRLSHEFKNREIKRSPPDIEPHEILLDKLAKRKEEELGISEKKFETPLLRIILRGLLIFSLLLILLLFVRTFQLQILEQKKLATLAERNKYIVKAIQAERGVIYDRNLNQLVFNQSSFDLVLEKTNLPKLEEERNKVLKEVSQILKLSSEDLEKKIAESEIPQVLIAENLDHQTLIILETKITALPGFQIVNNPIREYREGKNFSHLIGYTGKILPEELKKEPDLYSISDYIGRAGLESFYEEVLRKNPGKMRIERDALGNIISQEVIQLPESGKSLVLWLDSDLQKKIREVLEKQRQTLGAKGAAAVVVDPKTGGVLALVSLPDFDNNLFQKGADSTKLQELLEDSLKLRPLFNRAISGRGYLTGSTIKPLIASAALEEKIISPEKQIFAGGFIEVPDRYNPEKVYIYRDWKVHGWTDLRKAIAQSVNVYFYTIGGGYGGQIGLGPSRIKKYLELFGWGEKTGIDLPNEGVGLVPNPEWKKVYFEKKEDQIWYDGNTYYLSIGQEYVSATPLQVTVSIAAIANGGKLFQPQVVKSIVDNQKNLIKEITPQVLRENFIDSKNLQVVREGMRQTVTQGTASSWLNSLPVSSAAKTGSAQTGKFDKYGNELLHNWVTIFAPYEDPEIVLTLFLENVPGTMAGPLPVAKEILEWYFRDK